MATNKAEAILEEEIDQLADEIVEEIEEDLKLAEADNKTTKKSAKAESSSKKNKNDEIDEDDDEEEMEEGELPPALKKAIDAKKKGSDDDDDDEKDEEKGVKEALELPKTKHEMMRNIFTQMQGTNKKQLSDAYARLMGNLLGEEEDEEEDAKASSSKKTENRKTITKEDIDVADDLNALFGDNDLSEEFKTQTQTIFEAAVVAKINTELDLLENNYAEMLENAREEIVSEVTDKVDNYLGYVVEEWVKDNELSVERGLKTEITEEFIGGLKSLFEEHYIDVPEEKVDVVDSLADRIETLESELNENIDKNVELSAQVTEFQKTEILRGLSDDLTDIEFEKLKGLSEGVEFEDCDQYESALKTIKENYFPKNVQRVSDEEDEISTHTDNGAVDTSPQMAAYMNTISRTVDKPVVETS